MSTRPAKFDRDAPSEDPPGYYVTAHAVRQAQAKFNKLKPLTFAEVNRMLVAALRHAKPSPHEHIIAQQGFLDSEIRHWRTRIPISFAYREDNNGVKVIVTSLTRAEVLGAGASRARTP